MYIRFCNTDCNVSVRVVTNISLALFHLVLLSNTHRASLYATCSLCKLALLTQSPLTIWLLITSNIICKFQLTASSSSLYLPQTGVLLSL